MADKAYDESQSDEPPEEYIEYLEMERSLRDE
jgi:hypothetical protein